MLMKYSQKVKEVSGFVPFLLTDPPLLHYIYVQYRKSINLFSDYTENKPQVLTFVSQYILVYSSIKMFR